MKAVLHPDLKEFLFCLKRHDVKFVVIGAYVLATLGRPRYSDDLDVFVEPSPENADAIARALIAFGGFHELAQVVPDHLSNPDRMITIGRPPLAIDMTTGIDGVTFAEAWSTRREIDIEGQGIPFLAKAEYVRTKRAAGRPKDLADLALLQEAGLLDDVEDA
jgi:hypothetical protein